MSLTMLRIVETNAAQDRHLRCGQRAKDPIDCRNLVRYERGTGGIEDVIANNDFGLEFVIAGNATEVVIFAGQNRLPA